jgi:phosphoenolpyruvate synthase/pyruvate phosphate dikinase
MPIALLKEKMPNIYKELHDTVKMLERHMHDMQDTEFTVQDGTLFMLQTRNGKRTGPAALRIAIDLEAEVRCCCCVAAVAVAVLLHLLNLWLCTWNNQSDSDVFRATLLRRIDLIDEVDQRYSDWQQQSCSSRNLLRKRWCRRRMHFVAAVSYPREYEQYATDSTCCVAGCNIPICLIYCVQSYAARDS